MTITTPYFAHDVNAQRDDKIVRLLQTLGWKGYGVYWALIERLHEQKDCALEYNPKGLAWSLHLPEKYLIRVLTEFGLFAFSEDGQTFWSPSARRRRAYRSHKTKEEEPQDKPKRKRGRPRKNPLPPETEETPVSPEPKKEPKKDRTPKSKTESFGDSEQLREETPKTAISAPVASERLSSPTEDQSIVRAQKNAIKKPDTETKPTSAANPPKKTPQTSEPVPVPVESIIASWNQIFSGTRQTYKGLYLDSIAYQRAQETLSSGYKFEHIEEAFKIARSDNFSWLLKDVLKPDNIQRLLIKGDKANANSQYGASVFGNSSGASQPLPSDDWGNPDKWSRFEVQQN